MTTQDPTNRLVSVDPGELEEGDAPIDITAQVRLLEPEASPRMLTRVPDAPTGFACVSSICTHQGCDLLRGSAAWGTVDEPIFDSTSWILTCPCHGSRFDVRTGRVVEGPASDPLPVFQTEPGDDSVLVSVQPSTSNN